MDGDSVVVPGPPPVRMKMESKILKASIKRNMPMTTSKGAIIGRVSRKKVCRFAPEAGALYAPDGEEVAVSLEPKRALTLAQELLTCGVQAIKADTWDAMYEQGAPQRAP